MRNKLKKMIEFAIELELKGADRNERDKIGKVIRRSNETLYHYITKALAVYHAETVGKKLTATEVEIGGYVYDVVIFDPKTRELIAIEIHDNHKVEQTKNEDSKIPILEFEAVRDLSSVFNDKAFQDLYFMVSNLDKVVG